MNYCKKRNRLEIESNFTVLLDDLFVPYWGAYISDSPLPILPVPPPDPSGTQQFVLCIYGSVSGFCLFCFLNSTYK